MQMIISNFSAEKIHPVSRSLDALKYPAQEERCERKRRKQKTG